MIVASRMKLLNPSATIGAISRAAALERQGRKIISFGRGEPDFETPLHIRQAGCDAITSGRTLYAPSAGLPQLREAISAKLLRENGLEYSPSQISVGCGAKQGLYNILLATVEKGDEVIVPAPYWVSYVDIAKMVEGTPIIVPTLAELGYRLTPDALDKAITPRTKWLILCTPSNPSGSVYSSAELLALAEVLHRHPHVNILVDSIYEHIVYDGVEAKVISSVAPELHERTTIINGMSKGYCMTGWRVGYVAGPAWLVNMANDLVSQTTSSASTIGQWAAVAALNGDTSFLDSNRAILQKRRDLVVANLNAIEGLICPKPEGAFYVFPSCAGVIGRKTPSGNVIASDSDFADYLLEYASVSVVPGAAFGLSPFFRISYALSTEAIQEGCDRIREACEALE